MKSTNLEKLLLLLVAAGWNKRSILDVIYELQNASVYEVENKLELIMEAKSSIYQNIAWSTQDNISINIQTKKGHFTSHSYVKEKKQDIAHSDLYIKIRNMLIEDLDLTNEEIVTLISDRLEKGAHVPPLSKKSIENWLSRLSNHVPPSEVLHAATVIWDEYKKKNKTLDWKVRNEK
ncbi:hypothetical protein ACLHTA_01580 [Pseudomonas aeruginosa]|uniref:hypothetical protein n=1 Tax=Pseudomonas aeruginosa TaxID=287 RepID=UPI002DE31D2C|nr:hypothetical protein [Pseudomonas aeruginosa]